MPPVTDLLSNEPMNDLRKQRPHEIGIEPGFGRPHATFRDHCPNTFRRGYACFRGLECGRRPNIMEPFAERRDDLAIDRIDADTNIFQTRALLRGFHNVT